MIGFAKSGDKIMKSSKKTGTILTHIGNEPKKFEGVVNMPVHRTSTIVFDS